MLGNIDAPAWAIFERGLYTANIYAYYLQGQCDRLSDLSSLPSGIASTFRIYSKMIAKI
mgnify:CR=1 FL=1